LKDGIVVVVEVDGDTVHRETPVEAQNRTNMLAHEGAYVERVNAKECVSAEKAGECALKILTVINKIKSNK
jgi:very-short-patch-repair endonuclease